MKDFKRWVGQSEHLCWPVLAMGCQFVTFDEEVGVPRWPWSADQPDVVLTAPPIMLPLFIFGVHLAPVLSDYLKLWPSPVSDVLPVHMMFVLPPCELGVLCTPGQHGLDGGMRTDERMFNCWKNKKKCFFPPLLELYLLFGLVWSLRMMAEFLLWHFFSESRCQVLLTTVEAPSVYTIPLPPPSPWNYRILWVCFSLGITLLLGSD